MATLSLDEAYRLPRPQTITPIPNLRPPAPPFPRAWLPGPPTEGGPERRARPTTLSLDEVYQAAKASSPAPPLGSPPEVAQASPWQAVGQNVVEAFKGMPGGAVGLGGAALTGAGALLKGNVRKQLEVMDRIDRGESVPEMEDVTGYQHMDPEQRSEARRQVFAAAMTPLSEQPLVKQGQALSQRGQTMFPAAPGYEQSPGRMVGAGLGSLGAGLGASLLTGPVGAGALFALTGSGEAADRALKAGAKEKDVIAAAKAGVLPGLTDSLPIETLLGRVPVPGAGVIKVPAGSLGRALRGIGRIGWQGFIEGVQEGGQEFLQNLIAREVYAPEQKLGEGVVPSGAVGGGVGALAEAGRQAIMRFAGRRGGAQPARPGAETAAPEPDVLSEFEQLLNRLAPTEGMTMPPPPEPAEMVTPRREGEIIPPPRPGRPPPPPPEPIQLPPPEILPPPPRPVPELPPAAARAPGTTQRMSVEEVYGLPAPAARQALPVPGPTPAIPLPDTTAPPGAIALPDQPAAAVAPPPPEPAAPEAPPAPGGLPEGYRVRNEHIDTVGRGENIYRRFVTDKSGKNVAGLEYRTLKEGGVEGPPRIDMIKTAPEAQRKGLASALLDSMADEFGYENLEWTYQSPEGVALRKAYEQSRKPKAKPREKRRAKQQPTTETGDVAEGRIAEGRGAEGRGAERGAEGVRLEEGGRVGEDRGRGPADQPGLAPAGAPSPPRPAEDQRPREPEAVGRRRAAKGPSQAAPLSLFEFIARTGGMKDDRGEMKSRNLTTKFLKPYGRLVRPKGLGPDYVLTAAIEAGYLRDDATVDDLYSLIDREAAGNKVYPVGAEADVVGRRADREAAAANAQLKVDIRDYATELGETLSETDIAAIERAMIDGDLDAETAVAEYAERLAIEAVQQSAEDSGDDSYADIPFEAPARPAEGARAAPESDQRPARQAPDEGEGPTRGAAAAEGPRARAAPEVTTELTPEGLQTVLPGAEQISQREMLERRMAGRDVRRGQKGLEGAPLFDEGTGAEQGTIEFHAGVPFGKLWDWFLGPWFAKHYETMGTLPGGKRAYMQPRRLTQGRVDQMDQLAGDIHRQLDRYDAPTKEQIYEYLTTAGSQPGMIANPQARRNAITTKKLIDVAGQELVNRGALAPEQYEKYKDAYLPRMYLKFLFETEGVSLGAGSRPIVSKSMMDRLKKRKDLPKWEREILLGEIKDPAYLAARAFGEAARSIAIWDFLETVASHPEWVYPPSLVRWRGRNVTARWLEAEAQRLRGMKQNYPAAMQPAVSAMAEEMENTARAALAEPPDPKLYKQVPDSKRYGYMRGLWARKEIYDDLVNSALPTYSDSTFQHIAQKARAANSLWKGFMTAWSLPAQMRNLMSGYVASHLFGRVPFHRMPDRLLSTLRDIAKDGPYWQAAKRHGVKSTSFAQSELLQIHNEFKLKLSLDHYKKNPYRFARELFSKINDTIGNVYSMNEQVWKTLVMMHHMKAGMPEADAADIAHEAIFDYSDVPNWVRHMRSTPLPYSSPFLTFTYKALPKILESALTNPVAYLPYIAMVYASWGFLKELNGLDDEEAEKLWNVTQDWLKHGLVLFLPGKDQHGRWLPIDLSYIVPFGGWWNVAADAIKGDVLGVAGGLGIGSHPLTDMFATLTRNQDNFGRPVYTEGAPRQQQLQEIFSYMLNRLLPLRSFSLAVDVAEAAQGKLKPRGQPGQTTAQALAKLGGVNVYPFDSRESRRIKLYLLDREVQEAQSNLSRIGRDRSLSPAERREEIEGARAEVRRRQATMRDYGRATAGAP